MDQLTKTAITATLHCLTGCAIGEVLGMVLSTALSFDNITSIVISIALAFVFGYGLTMLPLLRSGMGLASSTKVAFASDTASITSMEIVDNLFIVLVPGALAATLSDSLFWTSLIASLVIAFIVTVPVNRWLISRGMGHAHAHHHHH